MSPRGQIAIITRHYRDIVSDMKLTFSIMSKTHSVVGIRKIPERNGGVRLEENIGKQMCHNQHEDVLLIIRIYWPHYRLSTLIIETIWTHRALTSKLTREICDVSHSKHKQRLSHVKINSKCRSMQK